MVESPSNSANRLHPEDGGSKILQYPLTALHGVTTPKTVT